MGLQGVRGVSPKRHSMERGNQGRRGAADAEQGSSSTGARKGGDAVKREAPEQQGPVSKRTRRMRPDAVAAAAAAKPADSNCSDALSQVHACLAAHELICTSLCGLAVLQVRITTDNTNSQRLRSRLKE